MLPLASTLILLSLGGCFSSVDWTLLATPEVCDGVDNDKDDRIDEGLPQYADVDGDGFGDPQNVLGCEAESGAVMDGTDCDDGDAAVHPGAEERCDGLDNDCDTVIDDGLDLTTFYADADEDGFGDPAAPVEACESPLSTVAATGDCDDGDAGVYPSAPEVCGDGVVNDCELSLVDARAACPAGELSLSGADAILTGEGASDFAGASVSNAGNLNGDGEMDLLIGAWNSERGGNQSGAAYVMYGPASGIVDLASADAVIVGESANNKLGEAVDGGADRNNDGFDDVLIGAPYNDRGGDYSGSVYLLYGPLSGVIDAGNADVIFIGEAEDNYVGSSLAWVRDIDGDERDDVLIGVHGSARAGSFAGAAYLFTSPVSGEMNLSSADCIITGESSGDYAGYAVADAGDTNGDGIIDIVIGAIGTDVDWGGSGSAHLYLGPLSGELTLADADASVTGEASGVGVGANVRTAGDTNADGYDDVLVSTPYNNRAGSSAGAVYLLLGPVSNSGVGNADAILVGETSGDRLSTLSRSPQDLSGDSVPDVVAGAYFSDRNGSDSGAAYLFVSPVSGVQSTADADVLMIGEDSGGNAGTSIAALPDQDGDGLGELLIGAYQADRSGTNAGTAYLILGKSLWNY